MKKSDSKKVPAEGERWKCPRCGETMQRWKHADDWKPQPDKGWYLWWFECRNRTCHTTLVMPKGAYVKPGGDPPIPEQHEHISAFDEGALCAEDIQRLAHFRGI